MSDEQRPQGLVFPADDEGRRSTSALGRSVVADALRGVDPAGSAAALAEPSWRSGYLAHLRRLVEAGLVAPDAWTAVAQDGLDSLHRRMRVATADGDVPLDAWPEDLGAGPARTEEVRGTAEPVTELVLPYRGERLRGNALRRHVDGWVAAGVVEPTVATAVDAVVANPDWLRLEGRTVAVLGAGSEMGPLPSLVRWGARVVAVDLAGRPELWERVLTTARRGAGTVLVPVRGEGPVERTAGLDLLQEVPAVASWLLEQPGELVLGNYVYADGALNTRVSVAVDELSRRVVSQRPGTGLAFLATPTDVFVVPGEAVAHATQAYEGRSSRAKLLGRPLRTLSGGRLLRRQYVAGADPGVHDALVPQQGPNYALAKRLQRWRAAAARHDGTLVSMNVAPPTRTRSVVKNRALAAAYAGAHRFGVEVFEPATSHVLMAALLVHDLHTDGGPRHDEPWRDEAWAAAHGGLWRTGWAPRSALGLAALLGYGAARG